MKKVLAFILIIALSAMTIGLSACAAPEKTEIVIGISSDFEPYSFLDEASGEYAGFDVELARLAADRMEIKVRFVEIDMTKRDAILKKGEIDVIWSGCVYDSLRADEFVYSQTYFDNTQVVIVRSDSDVTKLEELSASAKIALKDAAIGKEAVSKEEKLGKRIELVAGEYKSNSTVTFTESDAEAMDGLRSGYYTAVVVSGIEATYFVNKEENKGLFNIISTLSTKEEIVVKSIDKPIMQKIDAALTKLMESGDFDTLAKKYGIYDFKHKAQTEEE